MQALSIAGSRPGALGKVGTGQLGVRPRWARRALAIPHGSGALGIPSALETRGLWTFLAPFGSRACGDRQGRAGGAPRCVWGTAVGFGDLAMKL